MLMTLRKVSWNKGQTDNGIEYDYCRIDCDMPIYEGSKNEFGVDSFTLEFGPMERHKELLHLKGKLPVQVDVAYHEAKKAKTLIGLWTICVKLSRGTNHDYAKKRKIDDSGTSIACFRPCHQRL